MSQLVDVGCDRVGGAEIRPGSRTAGEVWNCAEPTPEPASAELDVTATEPRTFAAATGAVTEPVGAVESIVKVIADVAVLPNASAPVIVYAAGALAPLAHAKLVDV